MSHPLQDLGSDDSAGRFSLLVDSAGSDRRLTNAFCVTVYNEPESALRSTLHSLLLALRHSYFNVGSGAARSIICIIVDGKAQMHASLREWLRNVHLTSDAPRRHADLEIHCTSHHADSLTRDVNPSTLKPAAECMLKVHVVICIKSENLGKLESHALFFREICTAIQPEFCYQIDAGTTVAEDSVSRMIRRMDTSRNVGAIAPRVMPAVPAPTASALENWQFYDFALHKAVYWPLESMTGFLSVIPGQTCVFRWAALKYPHRNPREPDPVCAYLRGLATSDAVERVMYLAEDRIIGSEIALKRDQDWILDYLPEAGATTDACATYAELFRQRRRWINSAAACRLWLLALWARITRRGDGGPVPTRKHAAGMSVQLLIALKELLSPAQVFAALLLGASQLGNMWSKTPISLSLGIVSLVAAGACALLELRKSNRQQASLARIRAGAIWTACIAGIYVCSQALSWQGFLIIVVPFLAFPCLAMLLPRKAMFLTIRTLLFPIPHMVFSNILLVYSVLRINNVAWGTKGLVEQNVEPALKASLKRLKNKAAIVFFVANLVVAYVAWNFRGFIASELNPVIELACLSEAAVAVTALIFFIRRRRPLMGLNVLVPSADAAPMGASDPAHDEGSRRNHR
ncbi:MAG: glycosyltransferase family 2 protein [Pseudomonadota bacterium]